MLRTCQNFLAQMLLLAVRAMLCLGPVQLLRGAGRNFCRVERVACECMRCDVPERSAAMQSVAEHEVLVYVQCSGKRTESLQP